MNELYFKSHGNLKCGFMLDPNGVPYLLGYLSYKGSENLLDNYRDDRGREFQSCLLDGFIDHAAGDDFYVNTTNPTHGGGDYGRAVPVVTVISETQFSLEVELPAYDYMPHNYGGSMKPYKAAMLLGRYPATGWSCRVKYTIEANAVFMENEYFITDGRLHRVYFYRPMVLHLSPKLFDHDLVNENKRDLDSFLQGTIKDDHIMAKSVDNKIQIKATAGVTSPGGLSSCYSHRCFRQADRMVPAPPGTDDVWEAMLITEPMKFYNSTTKFKGWGRIDLQPVKLKFDLIAMIKNILRVVKERMSKMQIICDDGELLVTENQMAWLRAGDYLVDMSSNPMVPADTGYFNGTVNQLQVVLDTMPDGWTIPAPPPVDPPADPPVIPVANFEQTVLSKLDEIIGLLNQ